MHDGETAYYITDLSFFDAANALATLSPPLLKINLVNPNSSAMPVGTLELTAHGRRVPPGKCGSLHQEDQGEDRAGAGVEDAAYALDAGRCSFNSVTRSRCASTASGSSCSAA